MPGRAGLLPEDCKGQPFPHLRGEIWYCKWHGKSAMVSVTGGDHMAAKNKLRTAAVKIGSAVGRADGTAHKAVHKATKAVKIARQELNALANQVDKLKKQLNKSTKRLKSALK